MSNQRKGVPENRTDIQATGGVRIIRGIPRVGNKEHLPAEAACYPWGRQHGC